MARRKSSTPIKKDGNTQKTLSWNLGGSSNESQRETPDVEVIEDVLHENTQNTLSWNLGESSNESQRETSEVEVIEDVLASDKSTIENDGNTIAPILKRENKGRTKRKKSVLDPQLEAYLKNCTFYIIIKTEISIRENLQYELGEFFVTLLIPNTTINTKTVPILYLYISEESTKCFLYWELNDASQVKVCYSPVECKLPFNALKGLQIKKNFMVVLKEHTPLCGKFVFAVYLNQDSFCKLNYQFDHIIVNRNIQSVMELFYGITIQNYPKLSITNKNDIDELYSFLSNIQMKNYKNAKEDVQHIALIPELRPYQADAVRWMLSQERGLNKSQPEGSFHPLFIKIHTKDEKIIYYNRFGGFYTLQEPTITYLPLGGILADEMGLGKTVEVLACLLCNPRVMPNETNKECDIFKVDNATEEKEISSNTENESANLEIEEKGITSHAKNESTDLEIAIDEKEGINSDVENESTDFELTDDSWKENSDEMDDSDDSYEVPIRKRNRQKRKCVHKSFKSNKCRQVNAVRKLISSQQYLECLCGKIDDEFDDEEQIQCQKCGLWQHLECIEKKYYYGHKTSPEKHICPHCWVSPSVGLVPSRATLIVTPSCISYQWEEEIEKHIAQNSLKVLVYYGVHTKFIPPPNLADCDIVLTTYNVLRRELNYVDLPHVNDDTGRRFRNPKRFMTIPSPLLSIEWWRICLDEAQMVESATTKTAEMARRLAAVHRWCVTGTPIQKSVDDLYGLLLFLGVDPYCVKLWWKEVIFNPYCHGQFQPLYEVLNGYFWRTIKKDVLDQIGIPKQEEKIHWLSFSPVENHFYFRQHLECSQEATRKISKFPGLDIKLSSLDRHSAMQLLYPLRRLRQACCHPQAVRGEFLPIHKSTLTMEELLTSLIKKVKIECEEAHRQSIAALNGLAAIHIIKQEYVEAVEKYREVLRSVEDHAVHIKTDKLQQLHTLHNLAEILEGQVANKSNEQHKENNEKVTTEKTNLCTINNIDSLNGSSDNLHNGNVYSDSNTQSAASNKENLEDLASKNSVLNPPPGVGRTLNDDNLQAEAAKLRSSYLAKCLSQVTAAQDQLNQATANVKEMHSQFKCQRTRPWWIHVINHSVTVGESHTLVQKVKDDLLDNRVSGLLSAVHKFHDYRGMQYIILTMLDDLQNSYKNLSTAVRKLSATPSPNIVSTAVDCHLRPVGKNKVKCIYCKVHELFNHYESKLFYFSEDVAVTEPTTSDVALLAPLRRGTWADSELELILKLLFSFAKSHGLEADVIEDGNNHIKIFESLKKEFRALRAVWMQIRDHASAIDELDMATLRFRVRYEDEPQPEVPVPYILEKEEVEYTRLKLMAELAVSKSELRKKLGQLFYLQNLAKADFGRKGGSNPDTCPICRHVLGVQWNVLQCGHCFCASCIHTMISNYSTHGRSRSVRCPVCRQLTSHAEISFVNTEENSDKSEIPVKGSHSSKVEGIIRCLLEIKNKDPKAKVLVFSTWQDVLNVLSRALVQNEISFVDLHSRHGIVANLTKFRLDNETTALLLPVRSGANGLNLVEASHIILVEPLLNPASEQQAIGRIHRIGQTRPTVVHRFIVQKTIEENMHHMLQTHSSITKTLDTEDHNITLQELQQLFVYQ